MTFERLIEELTAVLDVVLRIRVLLPGAADSAAAKLLRIDVCQVTVRLRVLNVDLLTAFVVMAAASF